MEKKAAGLSYTKVFSDWICDLAEQDPRVFAVTPAMCEGSGLVEFSRRFADRYHDVGIAEQHAVTFAAGLACEGQKPVVAIYSTFLQRAYDQLLHDVALQNLDVTFAVDRAGFVGADGATHAGSFDLSYVRCVPNMAILAPSDEAECRALLQTAYEFSGPALVRYPRGGGLGVTPEKELTTVPWGKGRIIREGKDVVVLNFGSVLGRALEVAERLNATVADMRFVKPLDQALIKQVAANHSLIVTLEENAVAGGAGAAVAEYISTENLHNRLLLLGMPDLFIEQASQAEQLDQAGLSVDEMCQRIQAHQ
jgi:1-deoxy-D-xylulose-5-phosphate synthase